MVNQNVEKRMISFINTAADRCRHCLRKSPTTCEKCESSWAQSIMTDILATTTENTPDYSLAYRMKLIRARLQHANRPLLASEIHLDGLCSMQLKYWTLRYMVRKGVLSRTVAFRRGKSRKKYYRYFLRKKKETTKNETHTNRDHESQAAESRPPRALRQGAHGDRRP